MRLSQTASSLSPSPLPGTAANVARGIAHLHTLQGHGGTEMISGIRAALAPPGDPRRLRIVLLLNGWLYRQRARAHLPTG